MSSASEAGCWASGTPKYLNSPGHAGVQQEPESLRPQPGQKHQAGQADPHRGVSWTPSPCHQAGFDCAVAITGHLPHCRTMPSSCPGTPRRLSSATTGTTAGVQAATHRAIPMLEKAGLKVRVLRITGAKDPDEFIKTFGREAFARLLDRSENYVAYNLKQLQASFSLRRPPPAPASLPEAGAELLRRTRTAPWSGRSTPANWPSRPAWERTPSLQEIKRCRSQRLWEGQKEAGQTGP